MLTIIGCGNSTRSDDGVGVFVAQALQARLRENPRDDVRVFDAGTSGMEVMFQAAGTRQLIVASARAGLQQLGSHRGDCDGIEIPGNLLAAGTGAKSSGQLRGVDAPLRLINDLDLLGFGADDVDLLGHGYSTAGGLDPNLPRTWVIQRTRKSGDSRRR